VLLTAEGHVGLTLTKLVFCTMASSESIFFSCFFAHGPLVVKHNGFRKFNLRVRLISRLTSASGQHASLINTSLVVGSLNIYWSSASNRGPGRGDLDKGPPVHVHILYLRSSGIF
jgi:hypothetical protein